jgi:hypothetical protein
MIQMQAARNWADNGLIDRAVRLNVRLRVGRCVIAIALLGDGADPEMATAVGLGLDKPEKIGEAVGGVAKISTTTDPTDVA